MTLKTKLNKLDINKLTIVLTSLNYLKTKIVDLDIGTLKAVPVNLNELIDVVDNEIFKTQNSIQQR